MVRFLIETSETGKIARIRLKLLTERQKYRVSEISYCHSFMHKWTSYGKAATIRVFSAVTIPWSQNTYDSRGFRLCHLCNQR